MKRMIALLLALLLLLTGVGSALAANYTLEEKFVGQMLNSAYRGTVTFEVSGEGSSVFDENTWALLKSLAPRLALEGDHSLTRGDGQATLTLLLDGKNAGKTTLLYQDTLVGVASDLLADSSTYYTFARDWDLRQMAQFLARGDSAWPSVWGMLLAVEGAPEEWKAKAREALTPYETKLGIWLNGYAAFSTGKQDGAAYTELSCQIPAQAMKAEIKQLMVDFYNDAPLLSLLREVVTAREAAAYLQPNMMQNFFFALDALALSGDIEIVRRYDALGKPMLDEMKLPFAENQFLSALTVSVSFLEDGRQWAFRGQTQAGMDFDLTCAAGEDMIYTGSAVLLMPEEEEDETSFVVVETAPERRAIAFDYNLSWDPGEEKYTLASDRFERAMQGTLVLKPREGVQLPTQALSLDILLSSGSRQRSATRLDATLTWRDMESGASVSAVLASKTAAQFAVASLNSVMGAVRVDLMTDDSRAALIRRWEQNAAAWAQTFLTKLAAGGLATVAP